MLRSEETVQRLLWTKDDMDNIFSSHVGPIPRVRLVKPQNTNNSSWSCHHHNQKLDKLKRKRDNDEDEEDESDDETDSHREQHRLLFDRNNRVNNNNNNNKNNKVFKYDDHDYDEKKRIVVEGGEENYPSQERQKEVTERELWTIASMCRRTNKWKNIAKRLGIKKNEIEQIRIKHSKRGDIECLYQCLVQHRQHSDKPMNIESILEALKIQFETYKRKLEEREKSISSSLENYMIGGEINKKRSMSELDLWRISEFIWAEWKPISRLLGLGEHQIAYVEECHGEEGARECAYQALLILKCISIETLLSALVELDLNYFARKLIQIVSMKPALLPF